MIYKALNGCSGERVFVLTCITIGFMSSSLLGASCISIFKTMNQKKHETTCQECLSEFTVLSDQQNGGIQYCPFCGDDLDTDDVLTTQENSDGKH